MRFRRRKTDDDTWKRDSAYPAARKFVEDSIDLMGHYGDAPDLTTEEVDEVVYQVWRALEEVRPKPRRGFTHERVHGCIAVAPLCG